MAESTVNRAFRILDLLGEEQSTVTPDEVAEQLDTTRSTAYRYIKTLCDTGFLMQLSKGLYGLGPRIVELERKIQISDPLLNCSRPLMAEFASNFKNSVLLLCGLWGDRVLCLHQEAAQTEGQHPPIIQRARGIPFPLFKGAASLSILASLPLAKRRSIYEANTESIAQMGLGQSWDEFRRQTRVIRDKGTVTTTGTYRSNLVGVAAPILNEEGTAIGSVTRILDTCHQIRESELNEDIACLASLIQSSLQKRVDIAIRNNSADQDKVRTRI